MNNNLTIDRIRQKLIAETGMDPNAIATQGYLRLESNISSAITTVNFPVTDNIVAPAVTERRLKLTDRFTITHMSLMVGRTAAGSAGATPTDAQRAAMKLYTNNNPLVFTTTGDNLRALYNGNMQIRVERTTYLDGLDLQRFWDVDTAQEGLQQTVTATVGTYALDGWQGVNKGFAMVQPEITLNGGGDNQITLNFPTSVNFVPTGNFTNFAVLILRGITWQNASKLNR